MEIFFRDLVNELEQETNETQKLSNTYRVITQNNTKAFERIRTIGDSFDQSMADQLLQLIYKLAEENPLPESYELACKYIEQNERLKVNRPE